MPAHGVKGDPANTLRADALFVRPCKQGGVHLSISAPLPSGVLVAEDVHLWVCLEPAQVVELVNTVVAVGGHLEKVESH